VNPARRRAYRFSNVFEKSDNVMVSSLFNLQDLRDRKPRALSDFGGVFLRDLAKLSHRLAGEHFNFQPDFKFALVRPDFAHLRPRITVNHASNIKASDMTEKRFVLTNTVLYRGDTACSGSLAVVQLES
jgi:hypothetical protein